MPKFNKVHIALLFNILHPSSFRRLSQAFINSGAGGTTSKIANNLNNRLLAIFTFNPNLKTHFFGLPNMHYICADEMYSQGKDCLTFGYAYYSLKGFDSKSLERLKTELRYKGANFTDSIATFRLKRDNIDGTLRLLLYDNAYQVIVSFEETED